MSHHWASWCGALCLAVLAEPAECGAPCLCYLCSSAVQSDTASVAGLPAFFPIQWRKSAMTLENREHDDSLGHGSIDDTV